MHPGFMHWWKEAQRRAAKEGYGYAAAGCGPGGHHRGDPRGAARRAHEEHESYVAMEDGGGSFGVRRPLRFMAHRLELNEQQVAELAAILDELKTERAQAAVDHRRSVGTFADSLAGEAFDEAAAKGAAELRVKSAERLRDAVVKALQKTHAMLDAEQRKQLAYLLRSGQLTI
jgi:Spy/CpxP family protein refolding chaperone